MFRRSSVIFAASLALLSTLDSATCFAAAAPAQPREDLERPRFLKKEIKRFVFTNTTTWRDDTPREASTSDLEALLDALTSSSSQDLTADATPTSATPTITTTPGVTSSDNGQLSSDIPLSLAGDHENDREALLAVHPSTTDSPVSSVPLPSSSPNDGEGATTQSSVVPGGDSHGSTTSSQSPPSSSASNSDQLTGDEGLPQATHSSIVQQPGTSVTSSQLGSTAQPETSASPSSAALPSSHENPQAASTLGSQMPPSTGQQTNTQGIDAPQSSLSSEGAGTPLATTSIAGSPSTVLAATATGSPESPPVTTAGAGSSAVLPPAGTTIKSNVNDQTETTTTDGIPPAATSAGGSLAAVPGETIKTSKDNGDHSPPGGEATSGTSAPNTSEAGAVTTNAAQPASSPFAPQSVAVPVTGTYGSGDTQPTPTPGSGAGPTSQNGAILGTSASLALQPNPIHAISQVGGSPPQTTLADGAVVPGTAQITGAAKDTATPLETLPASVSSPGGDQNSSPNLNAGATEAASVVNPELTAAASKLNAVPASIENPLATVSGNPPLVFNPALTAAASVLGALPASIQNPEHQVSLAGSPESASLVIPEGSNTAGGVPPNTAGATGSPIGTASPVGATASPVGGTASPVGGTALSIGGTASPVGGTASPVGGTGSPVGGTASPIGGTASPIGGTASPVGATGSPVGGTASPVGGTASPVGGTASSSGRNSLSSGRNSLSSGRNSITTSPVGGTASPVGGTASPVGGTASPVGGTASPVGGTASPVGATASPVGGTASPVGGTGTASPVGGTASPIGGTASPVGGTVSPIGATGSPVGGTASPIGATGSLAGETGSPVGVTGSPVAISSPAGGTGSPIATGSPVGETGSPFGTGSPHASGEPLGQSSGGLALPSGVMHQNPQNTAPGPMTASYGGVIPGTPTPTPQSATPESGIAGYSTQSNGNVVPISAAAGTGSTVSNGQIVPVATGNEASAQSPGPNETGPVAASNAVESAAAAAAGATQNAAPPGSTAMPVIPPHQEFSGKGPYTQSPVGYDTSTTQSVPTNIIHGPSSMPSATQGQSFGPSSLPSNVPLILYQNGGPGSQPPNTRLINIAFRFPLNYLFVYNHPISSEQMFHYVPLGICYGLEIDITQITMQSLRAWDTYEDVGYFTTLAIAFVPDGLVDNLALLVSTSASRFYHNPDNSTAFLLSMIDSAIPIIGSNATDGASAPFGNIPTETSSAKNAGAPIGGDIGNSEHVRASSVGIGVGVACGAAAYGAAMFFVARRYKKRRQSHTRSPSMFSSPVLSHAGPDAGAGAALMSGAMGERSASPYYDNDGRAGSRGSGRSGSSRHQISAPVMAENSLGWN
ncbi:hypothetical protein HO173_007184 [Letharia columbiana]|uniref:Uncharacterized protein n=1 Tax=Letharia columbiana TaxID=112416 RepID=A0A8H6FTS7_9LECA|nr:uncharacterized protein HO173_007184 [Letharia columbiana]KAF6234559.1 hypothetical protein HO173_007184 [Letharia columbiana]